MTLYGINTTSTIEQHTIVFSVVLNAVTLYLGIDILQEILGIIGGEHEMVGDIGHPDQALGVDFEQGSLLGWNLGEACLMVVDHLGTQIHLELVAGHDTIGARYSVQAQGLQGVGQVLDHDAGCLAHGAKGECGRELALLRIRFVVVASLALLEQVLQDHCFPVGFVAEAAQVRQGLFRAARLVLAAGQQITEIDQVPGGEGTVFEIRRRESQKCEAF